MAVVQALEYINAGYEWLVDIDLERFFDTVHHNKLMKIISHTIRENDFKTALSLFVDDCLIR
ncbi:hypothetical protein [Bacillus aquiflavi]